MDSRLDNGSVAFVDDVLLKLDVNYAWTLIALNVGYAEMIFALDWDIEARWMEAKWPLIDNGFCFFVDDVLLKLDVNYAWIQCACCNGSPCLVR